MSRPTTSSILLYLIAMAKGVEKKVSWQVYLLIPLLIGIAGIAVLIWHYGVNTPFWDDWEMVSIFQKINHHTLGFGDLWQQHNEHRIFFPLLILIGISYLTHWNMITAMFMSLVVASLTAGLITAMLADSFRRGWILIVAAFLVMAWFFSPVQWQNWLWGWQIEWFLNTLGVITSIFLLNLFIKPLKKHNNIGLFIGAMAAAFISTFSLANGMLVWVVGLLMLLVAKQSKRLVGLWATTGLIVIALYYFHSTQTPTPSGSAMKVLVHHPLAFIKFFLALLGGVVGSFTGGGLQQATPGGLQLPLIIGALLLFSLIPVSYLCWQRRQNVGKYLPWMALVSYSLISVFLTAYGRLGYGLDLVFKSRYTSFTLLYVIGLTVLVLILINESTKLKHDLKVLAVSTLVLVSLPIMASGYLVGLHNFRNQSLALKQMKACTMANNPPDSCLIMTYPYLDILKPRLEYVKVKHLGGY